MRVEDIVREVNRLQDRTDRLINYEQLQRVALRTIREKERAAALLRQIDPEHRWTVSEVI